MTLIINKKARRNYQILEELEVGVVLSGNEVKSLRLKRGNLSEAFVKISDGEAWVVNFLIPEYQKSHEGYDPGKRRKLLLHRRELLYLEKKMEGRNLALVPLRAYFKKNYVKLAIGLAKGKKQYEKKEALKRKDIKRELRRSFKEEQLKA